MSNTTSYLVRWGMPDTPAAALEHLNTRHGWQQTIADPGMIQAHRYAHGVDGRPDLADANLNHTHAAPPAPAANTKRPLTWVILGWNALMFAWIVYGLVATSSQYGNCAAEAYSDACQAGTSVGATLAIGGILFLTAIVDVILAVIWMVTKKDPSTR